MRNLQLHEWISVIAMIPALLLTMWWFDEFERRRDGD